MADRISALASAYRRGSFGAPAGGIVLAERRPLAMAEVAALGGSEAVPAGIAAVVGVAPHEAPNRAASNGRASVLWLGPARWLVVEREQPGRDLEALLRTALPEAAVTELGQSRTVLRIAGARARDLLAKGSGIDFHPRAFPAGACAQGLLGEMAALFHAVDDAPTFDLYIARSYALTAWEWLTESAAEYGYRVETPEA